MIYFFHRREEIIDGQGALHWYLARVSEAARSRDRREICRLFYDMADYIYDKRFDRGFEDGELVRYVNGGEASDAESLDRLRFRALKRLLYELDSHAPSGMEAEDELVETILFFLAKGNICLRISQYHMQYYSYAESDEWGKHAQELLWRAKQLSGELLGELNGKGRDAEKKDKKDEYSLYGRLIKLNLAKYHRNFARKNRRSDYDAAMDEFAHICRRIQQWFEKSAPCRRRQYALIWMDALADLAFIQRNRNMLELANKETILVYCEMKKIIEKCRISWEKTDEQEFWSMADGLILSDRRYWRSSSPAAPEDKKFWNGRTLNLGSLKRELAKENTSNHFLKFFPYFIKKGLLLQSENEEEGQILPYDISRFFMLVLNEFSVIRSNLHETGCYEAAVRTAMLADRWSVLMDGQYDEKNKEKHSIDAINNMSLALRKYYKFTLTPGMRMEDGENQKLFDFANVEKLLSCLLKYAEGNYTSRSELVKWYCLSLSIPEEYGKRIRLIRQENGESAALWDLLEKHFPELKESEGSEGNIQNLYLCGLLLYRLQAYSASIRCLDAVLLHREADYIRVASLGTKTRFLKASCLIRQGKIREAERILLEIREAMEFSYRSKGGSALPRGIRARYQDERIETMLAYCCMQRGDYRKARDIYEEISGWLIRRQVEGKTSGREKQSAFDQTEYRRLKPSRQTAGLRNLAGCLIFSGMQEVHSEKLGITYTVDDLFSCIRTLRGYAGDRTGKGFNNKSELLRGYQRIMFPLKNESGQEESRKENLQGAQKHFAAACNRKYGYFSPKEYPGKTHQQHLFVAEENKNNHRSEVEAFSAYLITLTELCSIAAGDSDSSSEENRKAFEKLQEVRTIKKILLSLPESAEVSLKAATALAEWLLGYKGQAAPDRKATLVPQLFRSFSYLRIYEERGARVFNELKEERGFRSFSPEQRGELLARLLLFYEPVKRIREEYCLCLNDRTEGMHLYHYTGMENLKKLLGTGEGSGSKFRINNCGYMNDTMEGNAFLKKIEHMYKNNAFSDEKSWEILQSRYYPQLNQTWEQILPTSSDVYVACVSVRQDSFPLWSIYGNREHGCNIEFDRYFFDVSGATYSPARLRKYQMSRYTDEDYPLYKVHYLSEKDLMNCNVISRENREKSRENEIWFREQDCGTRVLKIEELNRYLAGLTNRLFQLDQYLDEIYKERELPPGGALVSVEDPRNLIRRFAANRMDEIRFLFKSSDYSYESEIRTVYTASGKKDARTQPRIDMEAAVPKVYVEMDRKIENVNITLGSMVEDSKIDRYVTWLKQTGKVKNVRLSVVNRKS